MTSQAPHSDSLRFRWAARAVVVGSAALLAVYLVETGARGIGPLFAASFAVWITKLTIFGGTFEGQPFSPWELGLLAWVLDLLGSVALLASIASFERLPLAGPALREAHQRAGETLRTYPGVRRLAFWGVLILVFLPLPGSGAFTGTLLGRLVGMGKFATLLSVGIGAGVAVATYAAVAVFLGEQWKNILESPWIVIPSLLAIALFCWWAWLRVRRELERG